MNKKHLSRGAKCLIMALEKENNIDDYVPSRCKVSNIPPDESQIAGCSREQFNEDVLLYSAGMSSDANMELQYPVNKLLNLDEAQNNMPDLLEAAASNNIDLSNKNTDGNLDCMLVTDDHNDRDLLAEWEDFSSDCSIRDPDFEAEEKSGDKSEEESEGEREVEEQNEVNTDDIPMADTEIKRSRWKKSDPSKWKKNLRKKQKIESKLPKPINCDKCRYNCNENFTEELRLVICKNFWKSDYLKQKEFILGTTESVPPARRRVRQDGSVRDRKDTKKYYLGNGSEKFRVCKAFFIKTLSISGDVIDTAYKGKSQGNIFGGQDNRGKKVPHNKTDIETLKKVKNHIEKFPTIESHYSRKDTKRLYLDPQLSITKMYSLYKEECAKFNWKPVSEITYRRVFCKDYNLSFFKPKKDLCQLCTRYCSLKSAVEKQTLEEQYRQHLARKEDCKNAKASDKERCQTDKAFMCCTFDLQSVLQIPSSDVSSMYYSLKLCMYNFTIYELRDDSEAFCYGWTELQGKRGSSEIGSCLLKYIMQLSPEIQQICFYSDTCGGQNRNQNIAALFLYLVQVTNLEIVEHKFLESGHTFMEVDSMHSAIETTKRYVPVYTIQDWLNIFKLARSKRVRNKKGSAYKVFQMLFSDFRDLTDLSQNIIKNRNKNTEGENVNWLKVKCFRYEKTRPGIIRYRYDHSSEFKEILVFGKGRPKNLHEIELKNLYSKILPITQKKKNSLLQLCKKGDIPEEYHGWYKSLPTSKTAVDNVPGIESEDESDH